MPSEDNVQVNPHNSGFPEPTAKPAAPPNSPPTGSPPVTPNSAAEPRPGEDFKQAPEPQPVPNANSEPVPNANSEPMVEGEVIQGAEQQPGDKVQDSRSAGVAPAGQKPKHIRNKKPDGTPLDGEEKIFAGIGYISFLALLPLLARRDSEYCQHHGRQGLIIFIVFFFLWIIASFSGMLKVLVGILQIVVVVGGFLLAYNGEWFRVPLIYDLALKLKFPQKKATNN